MENKNQALKKRGSEVKKTLRDLIKTGKTREALILLERNWGLLATDIETYSIAGVIYSYQMRIEEAREIILKGLKKDPKNFDLLFNMVFVCELQEDFSNAWDYYQEAEEISKNESQKEDLKAVFKTLTEKYKKPE